MKKSLIISLVAFFILIIGLFFTNPTFAQTAQKDVQALIQQLQEQIKALQERVKNLQAEVLSTKTELEAVKTELRFTKALSRGATGDEVKQLQEFLKQFPDVYPQGLVSGYFGPLTEAAVRKFQEKQGIESVGVVGPKTLSKLNELVTEGAGASGVVPPGLLTAPGIQKKIETATTTPITPIITVPFAPTPVQPVTTAPTGVCLIKDNYMDIPRFDIADFGNGFAKYAVSGVNTVTGLKTACTKTIYDYLLQNYCKTNSNPVQRLVMTYNYQGIGESQNLSCGALGCDFISCSSVASLAPIAFPTTATTTTQTATVTTTPTTTTTATTTTATAGTTTLVISNIQVSNITEKSATITWTTSKSVTSIDIYFGMTTSYGSSYPKSASGTSHTYNLGKEYNIYTELLPATTYYFQVISTDSGGNIAKSSGQSFITLGTVSSGTGNSGLAATRLFPGQYDNTKYNVTVTDPDGIGSFLISCAGICSNYGQSTFVGGDPKNGTPPCPTSVPSGTVTLSPSDFPVQGWIIDCANASTKYTVQASMPPLPVSQSMTLLSPNGGETWTTGQTYTVQWQSTGYSGNVNIYLRSPGGSRDLTIAYNISNSGSYQWTVPASITPASDYTVEIDVYSCLTGGATSCSFTMGVNQDVSNAQFTVAAPITSATPVDLKINNSDNPAAVPYNSIITASWTSSATSYCLAYGMNIPVVGGGLWGSSPYWKFEPSGSLQLYASWSGVSFHSPIQASMECYSNSGATNIGSDTVSIPTTATSTSSLDSRAKNLAAILQLIGSLGETLEKLSQLLK
ncbi:MAG: peptidoglycan-binding protein [Parcubacteria group bacterium]|nr:peptidoglycan-binding protein [Parcubacteria group bacterium]